MTLAWAAAVLGAGAAAALALRHLRSRFEHFRTRVLGYLRDTHPDFRVARLTPTGAVVRVAGMKVHLDLASLFRRLHGRADPAALDQVADGIRAHLPVPTAPPFARVRDHILPLLKPATFVDLSRRYPPPLHLVTQPFPEGLAVVYVVEGFHQITYVTEGMVGSWEIAAEDLYRLALTNLRRHTLHLLQEIGGPRAVYEHLDGFEASRILVPELVTPAVVGEALAAIPDEHLLLIADRQEGDRLAREAQAAYARAAAPLAPAVFRLSGAPLVPEVIS